MYNLTRYQTEIVNMSQGGEFAPKKSNRLQETHVQNKPYAICKHQKTILESKVWPGGTYFKIEPVSNRI